VSRIPPRGRRLGTRALVVAASLALVLALVAAYARRALVDSDQFANRATVALQNESSRTLVAARITDGVVLDRAADLIAARPLIESAVSSIVGGRAFGKLFRSGVGDMHRALFARGQNTVTLTVADVGTVVGAALEKLSPKVAREIESTGRVALLRRHVGDVGAQAARIADAVRLLALGLLLASLGLVAAALALSADRRRTVVELGTGAAVAGVLLVVALAVVRSVAVNRVAGADEQAAARAVWTRSSATCGSPGGSSRGRAPWSRRPPRR
jgi:hypothetical protein